MSSTWLEVGRIGRPHGLAGEVQIRLTTDRPERLAVGAQLRARGQDLVVATSRPHQERWLVRFAGRDRREDVEELRGAALEAEALDEPGTLWVHAVVGRTVVGRDGTRHGVVAAVIDNPAHDLLELDSGALVPVVFIVDDTDPDQLVIDPPEGLL